MKKNLLLLMLALLLPAFMYGQEQTVSGTVLDTYNPKIRKQSQWQSQLQ